MPSHWTNGRAATETSRAVEKAIDLTQNWFENNPHATDYDLQLTWFNNINSQMAIYGGSVRRTSLFYVRSPAPFTTSFFRSNCG